MFSEQNRASTKLMKSSEPKVHEFFIGIKILVQDWAVCRIMSHFIHSSSMSTEAEHHYRINTKIVNIVTLENKPLKRIQSFSSSYFAVLWRSSKL
ncbi:CLUMA_CG002995, isoform A [Clunio marinus]|uniref:CLUMA_CG002995, isoform A n=1 Tax=Clunio marinus TaxID=568069 RepID=A0A1J1HPB8_9DIPT|nr:CLUMA_CG002995, isoform A [Clunio marinus]